MQIITNNRKTLGSTILIVKKEWEVIIAN